GLCSGRPRLGLCERLLRAGRAREERHLCLAALRCSRSPRRERAGRGRGLASRRRGRIGGRWFDGRTISRSVKSGLAKDPPPCSTHVTSGTKRQDGSNYNGVGQKAAGGAQRQIQRRQGRRYLRSAFPQGGG